MPHTLAHVSVYRWLESHTVHNTHPRRGSARARTWVEIEALLPLISYLLQHLSLLASCVETTKGSDKDYG
jgi:hypothetical protein